MPFFPIEIKTYFEPFLGSGAVFFYIKEKYSPDKVFLSDNNAELIYCFKVVNENPCELIELLKIHKGNHSKKYYYKIRAKDINSLSSIERAAQLIFIWLFRTITYP